MRACLRSLVLVDTDVLLLYVCTCCCFYYGVVAVLRLVVMLLLLLPLCTKKPKQHRRRESQNTEELRVQKKCRKQRKAGTVPQVIDGGGAQAGTSERPGRCQPSPLRKKKSVYVYNFGTPTKSLPG